MASTAAARRARRSALALALALLAALAAPPPAPRPRPAGDAPGRPTRAACRAPSKPRSRAATCRARRWSPGSQEVDAPRPRLAWQADKPVNPASLMKLVTTFAALELLGPAYTWSTPVWLQGPVADGVLDRQPRHQGQRRSEARARAPLAADCAACSRPACARSAATSSSTAAPSFPASSTRPISTASRCGPTTPAPTRCCSTTAPCCSPSRPSPARGVATIAVDPPLAGVRVDADRAARRGAVRRLARRAQGRVRRPGAACTCAGAFQAACGEKVWPLAYADPRSYNERALAGLWLELGGKLSGVVREGAAPATTPSFELRSPALAEVDPRHQQAQQQRDGAAALPDARRDAARRRHAGGGARGRCASGCAAASAPPRAARSSPTARACRATRASAPRCSAGCCRRPGRARSCPS